MMRPVLKVLLAALFTHAVWAHDAGPGGARVPPTVKQVSGSAGQYRVSLGYVPRQPLQRQRVEFEFKAIQLLDTPDPLLGSEMPLSIDRVKAQVKSSSSGRFVTGVLPAHAEGEENIFGVHDAMPKPGGYSLVLQIQEENGRIKAVEFPFQVEPNPYDRWVRVLINGFLLLLVIPVLVVFSGRRRSSALLRSSAAAGVGGILLLILIIVANLMGVKLFSDRIVAQASSGGQVDWSTDARPDSGLVKLDPELVKNLGIETVPAVEEQVNVALTVQGKVLPRPDLVAVVSAPLWGRIEFGEKPLAAGDYVRKDQLLVKIVLELPQNERAPMLDRFEEIKATLETAKERAQTAKVDLDRTVKLAERGAVLKEEVEWLRKRFDNAQEEASLLEQQYKQYQQVMRWRDPRHTPVTSPIDGVITEVKFVPGELNPDGQVRELFTIVDLSTVWLEAEVFERDIAAVSSVRAAGVRPQAYPNQELRARPVAVLPVVSETTRTLRVLFQTANPGNRLKIGMLADIEMKSERSLKGVVVPRSAVVEDQGQRVVYVRDTEGLFERRTVEIGGLSGEKVHIRSGLAPGENVVVSGLYQLRNYRRP